MRIGYACITVGVPDTQLKTCRQKNADDQKIFELIKSNLSALSNMLDYNIANGIKMFRISSELIPFGSSVSRLLPWREKFSLELQNLREKIQNAGIRISMHPGQYTVLNSPDNKIVENAVLDLTYHNEVLESLGADFTDKIVLHIGGGYGDKKASAKRFCDNYAHLDDGIKKRLILENDERT